MFVIILTRDMDTRSFEKINEFFLSGKRIAYKKSEVIIRSSDEPTGVYFVKKGHVKMSTILEDGTEVAVNIFKPGSYFPMTWAIANIENNYFYRSMEDTVTYRVAKNEFLKFIKSSPVILYDLTIRILTGLDGMLFVTNQLLHSSSLRKVATIILMMSKRFGIQNENGDTEIYLQLTHQDLAHFVGLSRETVSLAFDKLKKKGLVTQVKRKIVIKNKERLEQI